jgi:hypothetical protein
MTASETTGNGCHLGMLTFMSEEELMEGQPFS